MITTATAATKVKNIELELVPLQGEFIKEYYVKAVPLLTQLSAQDKFPHLSVDEVIYKLQQVHYEDGTTKYYYVKLNDRQIYNDLQQITSATIVDIIHDVQKASYDTGHRHGEIDTVAKFKKLSWWKRLTNNLSDLKQV